MNAITPVPFFVPAFGAKPDAAHVVTDGEFYFSLGLIGLMILLLILMMRDTSRDKK